MLFNRSIRRGLAACRIQGLDLQVMASSTYVLRGVTPRVHNDDTGKAWIAPTASVIGDVHLKKDASIWFGAVVRYVPFKSRARVPDGLYHFSNTPVLAMDTIFTFSNECPCIKILLSIHDYCLSRLDPLYLLSSLLFFSFVPSFISGDNSLITIGARSNIQDGAVLHTDPGINLDIGEDVTVGHMAMLHGCTIGNGSLIGIGAVILNNAVIGEGCLIGAKSLVSEGKVIPPYSLVKGVPGKVVRQLTEGTCVTRLEDRHVSVSSSLSYHGRYFASCSLHTHYPMTHHLHLVSSPLPFPLPRSLPFSPQPRCRVRRSWPPST